MAQCAAVTDPKSDWKLCPNIGAAYLYAVLFALTTVAHVVQMFWHRKWYSWVIIVSGVLQVAAYVLRVLSIQNIENTQFYTYWFVFMLVAPVWTNAYAYMVMGRMVYNFTPTASVFKIKAWRFGLYFVLLDIVAFLIQVAGAVIASGTRNLQKALNGIHIYMGGIGFQQACIFCFLALAVRFHIGPKGLKKEPPSPDRSRGLLLLYILYTVVGLITVRIIFRLIEYASGFDGTIPTHEAYQYVFDSTLMLFASILLNVFHPGRLMPGKESDLPSRKVRKNMKKQGEKPRGRLGQDYLLPKYQEESTEYASQSSFPLSYAGQQGRYERIPSPSPSAPADRLVVSHGSP